MSRIPRVGDSWSNYILRQGRTRDVDEICKWKDSKHQQSLDNAVAHLETNDGECFIIEQSTPGEILGLLTLHECFLNFAYVRGTRGRWIAKRAAGVLIAHFFEDESETYLAAGPPISPDGQRLLDCLGFSGDRLDRIVWQARASEVGDLFTPAGFANARLRSVWRRHRQGSDVESNTALWPLQYPKLRTGRMLFVGLNPSLEEENVSVLRLNQTSELSNAEGAAQVVRIEEQALGRTTAASYPYYGLFDLFCDEANAWEHIDVFAVREKSQERLKSASGIKGDPGLWTPFVREQIEICLELLCDLKPTVIVVVNAFASGILKRSLTGSHGLQFDEARGHHVCNILGKQTPVFFSGMLTGSRALDTHSRKRLVWHVRRALRDE